MAGKAFAYIDELMQAGRLEAYNHLKPWITQDHITFEGKGTNQVYMKNVTNFICFTNHKNSVIMEDDDGRFFVYFSPMVRQSEDYYKSFYSWLEGDGAAALMHWLLRRNIEHFNSNAPAPDTEDKRQMIKDTRTDLEKVLVEMIEDNATPFDHPFCTADDVFTSYRVQIGRCAKNPLAVSKMLGRVGCIPAGQIRKGRGEEKIRLWLRPPFNASDASDICLGWAEKIRSGLATEAELRDAYKKAPHIK